MAMYQIENLASTGPAAAVRDDCPRLDDGQAALDLARYPIDRPDSPEYRELVQRCRTQLTSLASAAVVERFVVPEAVEIMVAEAIEIRSLASPFDRQRTAWSPFQDPDFPDDHVRNRLQQDNCSLVAGDLIAEDTLNKRVYRWSALIDFLADCLDEPALYPHADPFQCLNLSFTDLQGQMIWHFDPTDFVVSILLQKAERGGAFEYAAGLRNEDEHDYDAIDAVIDGDHPAIKSLNVNCGDLVLFRGHNTLHRVSPVRAGGPRIISLLGYALKPGLVSPRDRDAFNYGPRVHDVWEKYGLPE